MGPISSCILRCNQLRLTSQIFFPEQPSSMFSRVKYGAEKLTWATWTNPHACWSWTGFPEGYPSSGFTAGRKDVEITSASALQNHTALKLHVRQKMTSKDCHVLKNPVQLAMDSREGSIVPWAHRLACVHGILNISSRFSVNCSSLGLPWWPVQDSASILQVGPWSSSLPQLLHLVCSTWQDPGSHWSAHVVDSVALGF